jgi:hypothetical protein
MSLRDKACYTLTLVPAPQPGVLYLVENYNAGRSVDEQEIRYGRVRETSRDGEVYSAALYGEFVACVGCDGATCHRRGAPSTTASPPAPSPPLARDPLHPVLAAHFVRPILAAHYHRPLAPCGSL